MFIGFIVNVCYTMLFCRNNFVQVDIFYQELSYEEIQQNVAFEFLSLLGEIGGFLGLLLGGSVLTIFELIDFIALTALNKVRRNAPAAERSASVAPEVNLGECTYHSPPQK